MASGVITRRRTLKRSWSPAEIPNLQLWLDAGSYLASVSDGASISTAWTDKAGLGDATASGGLTFRQSSIGGRPAVEFNGSTGQFAVTHRTGLAFQSRLYIAMVVTTGVVSANHTFFSKGDNAGDPDYILQVGFSSSGISFYDGSAWRSGNASALSASTSYILEMYWDGTNMWFYANGSGVGAPSAGAALQTSTQNLRIGVQGSGTTNPFDGKLAELILVGNGSADATGECGVADRRRVRNYLADKYGLSGYLNVRQVLAYNGSTDGTDYRIGSAFSADGITWAKSDGAGQLKAGSGFESSYVKDPHLLLVGSTWHLYYSGYNGVGFRIGHATHAEPVASTSAGTTWVRDSSNPVIPFGGSGAWDETHAAEPFVIYDPDDADSTRRWKMWYAGAAAATPGKFSIGYAYSSDGSSWTKYASNPVLSPGSSGAWDDEGILFPTVWRNASNDWVLFYAGRPQTTNPEAYAIGAATFTTPESTYTKSGSNPLLSPKGTANIQNLSANTNSGTTTVAVADTSLYAVNEPVFLRDSTQAFQLTKIASITDSTHLVIADAASQNWTTGNTASLRSAYYGSLSPRSILNIGGTYILFGAAFQQFANSPFHERAFAATSSSLPGTWSFDLTKGIFLSLGTVWDIRSVENPSVREYVL